MTTTENPNTLSGTPLLDGISSPADVRRLPVEALPQLCAEIRQFLINSLSENPGHFASSMGAVELTVALHYVFNTPYDRIVWDVGHQAYGHKILTGRREAFGTIRQYGGLSGFPNPDESEYDSFIAGHASNSISVALGFAVATRMQADNPQRNVVAVVGDASISGGLAFEGINNAANVPNDMLIVLNDNDMSIDRNVGSLNKYLARINTSKSYNAVRYSLYKAMKRLNLVNDRRRGTIMRLNNSLKSFITNEQNIFEGLNIRYFGPFDGHDVVQLVRVLQGIKEMTGPKILHLRTTKGKGYAPAEADPATWHAPGKFNARTGERSEDASKVAPAKYQDVFGQALLDEARKNSKVVGITAAMPSGTSIATMQAEMPDRVFDVGISEGHAVTFAAALAKEGMRPVVAIYSSFLQRAYDHIVHDVAIQHLPVVFAIDRAGIVGEDGVTHHGVYDMAYLRNIPGIVVAAPRNAQILRDMLHTALHQSDSPFAIRYPRGKAAEADVPTPPSVLPIGKAQKLTDGTDAAVISVGTMAANASHAIEIVRQKNISVAHYDLMFVSPLDDDVLRRLADDARPIFVVEDGTSQGGAGSAVAEWMATHGYTVPLTIIGLPDRFIGHGTVAELHREAGLDADSIAKTILQKLGR